MTRQRIGKQSEKNKKHRSHSLRRFFLFVLLGIVLFVALGLFARVERWQVSVGSFEGIVVTDTEQISSAIEEYLHQRFLYPKSNRVWFSERLLEYAISQSFPRLDMVNIRTSSGVLVVSASERQGEFLWCGPLVQEVRVDVLCYFADKQGFVFDEAPFFAGTTFVRLYGDIVGEGPIGQQGISPEIFTHLSALQETVRSFGFSVQAVQQHSDGQYEFILNSQQSIEQAPRIRFVMPDKVQGIVNLGLALQEQLVLLEIQEKYAMLEYLDIRFTNQVIYKFKDETPVYSHEGEDGEGEQVEEQPPHDEILEQTISEEETMEDSTEG